MPVPKKFRITKNPDVDTSFLPDKEREELERIERERLKKEWLTQQVRFLVEGEEERRRGISFFFVCTALFVCFVILL